MKLRRKVRDLRLRDRSKAAFRQKLTDPVPMWAVYGSLTLSLAAVIWGPDTNGFWQNILSNIALVGPGLFFTNIVARYSREKRLSEEVGPRLVQICGFIDSEYAAPGMKYARDQADLCGTNAESGSEEHPDTGEPLDLRGTSPMVAIDRITRRIDHIESTLLPTISDNPKELASLSMWHIYHLPALMSSYLTPLSRYMHTAQAEECFEAVSATLHEKNIPTVSGESSERLSTLEVLRIFADSPKSIDETGIEYGQLVLCLVSIGMNLRNGLYRLREELPGLSDL